MLFNRKGDQLHAVGHYKLENVEASVILTDERFFVFKLVNPWFPVSKIYIVNNQTGIIQNTQVDGQVITSPALVDAICLGSRPEFGPDVYNPFVSGAMCEAFGFGAINLPFYDVDIRSIMLPPTRFAIPYNATIDEPKQTTVYFRAIQLNTIS